MSDLTFATRGQAEALAAQEAIAKKGREIRDEFEAGARATGTWDSAMSKLKSTAESALRSVQTEQEKIVEQIAKIKDAQEEGVIPPEEAEAAVARLRERWIEVDEATKKQREDTERVAAAHEKLRVSADEAIDSVATGSEKAAKEILEIEQAIEDVQEAAERGLIPQDQADVTVQRLNDRITELRSNLDQTATSGDRMQGAFSRLFDPALLVKSLGAFVGIKAAINQIKRELEDIQARVDRRADLLKEPLERGKSLDEQAEEQRDIVQNARGRAVESERAQNQAAEQATKDQIDQAKEVAETEQDLARARRDRDRTEQQEDQRRKEAGAKALLDLQRAMEDRDEEIEKTGESSKGADRRLTDARARMAEYERDKNQPSSAVEAADERIAALEEQLQRQREMLDGPSEAFATATTAAAEARARLAEEEKKLAEKTAEAAAYRQSPEYQRATRTAAPGKIFEDAEREIEQINQQEGQMTTEDLEKLDSLVRSLGVPKLSRQLRSLVAKIEGGGTVDVEEVQQIVQELIDKLRNPQAMGYGALPGGGAPVSRPQTEAEKDQLKVLERVAGALERIEQRDGTFVYGNE